MTTSVEVDKDLLLEALALSTHSNVQALVHEALEEYLAKRQRDSIFRLSGKIEYFEDYDYKTHR